MRRILNSVRKKRNRAIDLVLREESRHGNHGEAAVFELRKPHLIHVAALSLAKRVKAQVTSLACATT